MRPKHFLWQLRIVLFLVVHCFAVGCSRPVRDERERKEIAGLSSKHVISYNLDNDGRIIELDLTSGRVFDDDDVASLVPFTKLTTLDLRGARITARGLQLLGGCPKLRTLVLASTDIGDDESAILAQLKKLVFIDMSDTLITDNSIDDIIAIPSLEMVVLPQGVSDEGRRRLLEARPNVTIIGGTERR